MSHNSIHSTLEDKVFAYPRFLDLTFDRLFSVLHNLDNPHLKLPPVIHVAGTNGKGSTIAFLYTILKTHGFKVHVFTSPHLVKLNERFVLANQEIDDNYLLGLIQLCEKAASDIQLTWFELLTCVAFLSFSQTKADFCLIETGLGGLHDATNIIENPILSLITSISYDHQDVLGKTLKEIAFQKAGILKKSSVNLIGQNNPEILDFYQNYIIDNALEGKIFDRDYSFKQIDKGFVFQSGNRLLSKRTNVRRVIEDSARKTAVYPYIHEDLSTETTHQSTSVVEFQKKSNMEIIIPILGLQG
ncbi:MAG: Mur ligase family protein, partial [Alphaproteobacteria bacterium]|nr:Mur ligase family protein [Alphaproteobacteria bacterium]